MARKEKPEAKPVNTYGLPQAAPEFHNQLTYEFKAFRAKWPISKGGLGRYRHFRNGCNLIWPWIKWNPWMERQCEEFCESDWIGVAGCAGSSKTTTSVIYGVFWWLCGIQDSAMVLTSTTKTNIRSRAWNWVQKLYSTVEGPRIGNMVDSRTTWQATKGDDRHCVCALAVREGSTTKAVGRLQGFHPDGRMLVIIDEATDTPEAIFDAMPNLVAGNFEFQVIALGNPNSRFDPFGKFILPLNGWDSISVEDDGWDTEVKLDGKPGRAVHFDAERSPNVIEERIVWDYLPTFKGLQNARAKLGSDSPWFWKFWRGFLAPEGVIQTVLSESMLARTESVGETSHVFVGGDIRTIAFLDPAFGGGDKAILRIGKYGEVEGGGIGIQLTRRYEITINLSAKENGKPIPIHYQIARQVVQHLTTNGVDTSGFGLDSTGEGGGLADILSQDPRMGSGFHRVEFAGSVSDERRVSNEDNRSCADAYDRKVTELYFTAREFVMAGQVKGVNAKEASDICNRLWRLKGKKMEIEPKTNRRSTGDAEESGSWGFKERMGRSPDDGDAFVGLCEVARRLGVTPKLRGRTALAENEWLKKAIEVQDVFPDEDEDGIPTENRGRQDDYALDGIGD